MRIMTKRKLIQINIGIVLGIIVGLALHQLAFGEQQGQIVKVEPNNGPPYYQVHYLKAGEKPNLYNYKCWGCNFHDEIKIYKETGLWNWSLGSPSEWIYWIN